MSHLLNARAPPPPKRAASNGRPLLGGMGRPKHANNGRYTAFAYSRAEASEDPAPEAAAAVTISAATPRVTRYPGQWSIWRFRVPWINHTILMLLSILASVVFAVLLFGALTNMLFASNTPAWPLYYGWILSAYILVVFVTNAVLAGTPSPVAHRADPDGASLRYYDATLDLQAIVPMAVIMTIISVFSLAWYIVHASPVLPAEPAVDVVIYITQQIVHLAFFCATAWYAGTTLLLHTNREARVVPVL